MAKKGIATLALEGATVIINGVERDSFCAEYGTQINWSVSKEGYESQSGSFTLTEDRTIDVVLVPITTYVKFEIVATPSDATVLINGEERTSIEVESGTTVTWSVSKEGYESQSGSQVVTADTTKEIVLEEVSGQYDPLVLTIDNSNGMQTPQVRRLAEDEQTFGTSNPVILACFGGSMDVEVNGTLYEDVLPTEGEDYTLQGLVSGTNVLKFYPRADGEKFIFNYAGYTDATLPNAHIVSIDDWGDSRFSSLYYAFYQLSTLKSVAKPSKSKTFADLTNACAVFYGATGLESLPEGFLADAGELEDATYFAGKSGLKALPNNLFNANAPVDLSYGFYQCPIEEVPAEFLKGSKVTSIYYMFYECANLTTAGASAFEGCENLTKASYCFMGCSALKTLGAGLFKGCSALETLENAFDESGVESIAADVFDGCTKVTTIYGIFRLTNVTTIPSGLFDSMRESLEDASYCFRQCDSLTAVPDSLFENFAVCKTFSYAFYMSSTSNALTTIGSRVFAGCSACTTIQRVLYNLANVTTIGESIFEGCESITDASYAFCYLGANIIPAKTFKGCKAMTTIPQLFNHTTIKEIGESAFEGCESITELSSNYALSLSSVEKIGAYAFAGCKGITTFENWFASNTNLVSVGAYAFKDCTGATTFASCFQKATSLQTIGEGLFDGCANVTNFGTTFYLCSALEAIPTGLFAGCSEVTSFDHTFAQCTKIAELPEDLLKDCIKAQNFYQTFGYMGIKTIPANLFENCLEASNLSYVFAYTSITEIPADLFKNCTKATDLSNAFLFCENLETIPAGLFDTCTEVTTFYQTFSGSPIKEIPENLFVNCKKVENFYATFHATSSSNPTIEGESAYDKVEIDGVETIIHLYERENYADIYTTPNSTRLCYNNQTKLADYDSIPSGWK